MRRVQEAALRLFERRGFDAVTIEEIAAAAEVSAPTVYRGFGTKEALVLWDEYDPMLLAAIEARLPSRSVRKSVVEALVVSVGEVYSRDRERILRRAKLMLDHPALEIASLAGLAEMKAALSGTLVRHRAYPSAFAAEVVAGAIVATLECAIRQWVRKGGRRSLTLIVREAFEKLDAF